MQGRLLILGRAGTGKTRRLTDRIASAISEDRGGRALLLVPTLSQASHLKRLLLSRYRELSGFFDESVVTFTSLAERIFPDRPIRELLTGRRQDLLLRRVLAAETPQIFRPLVRYPGFRRAALSFVKEVKQNGAPRKELEARVAEAAEGRSDAARTRLLAFLDLFRAYEDEREARGLSDHEDFLREARDVLRDGGADIPLDSVGVDGFQNFTRLERDLLLALADRAPLAEVTLPWAAGSEETPGSPFAVARETREYLLERGFTEVMLGENRRTREPDLVRLERELFSPSPRPSEPAGGLRVLEGADPEDEADRVARTVLELVRGDGRSWQEIVVVVRDAAVRGERFRHAFRRHGIPVRVYAKLDLSGHPFVRAVRHVLALAGGEWTRDRVLGLLRADSLREVLREEVDCLDDDLLAHGDPTGPDAWIERAESVAPTAAAALRDLRGANLPEEPIPAGRMRDEVLRLLFGVLSPLADRETGDPERLRDEALAVAGVRGAAEEVAAALASAGKEVEPAEFLSVFLEALRELAATPRDRRLPVVNLIDAREARQWEAPVVIVAGLVEGEFPRSPREDIFLGERDRRQVNDRGALSLKERALEREEERYLFYVALTRARDRLYLTYPATDGRGEASLPSLFLGQALTLFPEGGRALVSRRPLSEALPRADEVAGPRDLHPRALLGLSEPYRPGTAEEERARFATALHDRLVGVEDDPPDDEYLRAVRLGARFFRPPAGVLARPERIRLRHRDGSESSPSALTDFAQCPFLHFAARTLSLREPPRSPAGGVDALDLGRIAHEVLERLYRPATEGGAFPVAEDVGPVLDEVWDEALGGAGRGLVPNRLRARLLRSLEVLVEKEGDRLAGTGYRPWKVETDFGRRAGRPLTVRGEDGREVALRGRIDRIDVRGDGKAVVLDYKSSRGFDAKELRKLEAGTHLQLPLYLLAARDAFGLDPVGAFLLPVRLARLSGLTRDPDLGKRKTLGDEEFEALFETTRERVLDVDGRIRAGEIAIDPADGDVCPRCAYADVCRIEAWMREEEE